MLLHPHKTSLTFTKSTISVIGKYTPLTVSLQLVKMFGLFVETLTQLLNSK